MNSILHKGRKPTVIFWPEGKFTVKDVQNSLPMPENGKKPLSQVAIQFRINKAIKDGLLVVLNEVKKGKGKPAKMYMVSHS